MSVVQLLQLLTPVLIVPFLITKIGFSTYGNITFIFSIIAYFFSVTDYSFKVSATRDIATNLNRFIVFHFATSMAWDIPRAILTSSLIILTAPSILGALRRTKFRAAFVTPIEFVDSKNAAIERAKELRAL